MGNAPVLDRHRRAAADAVLPPDDIHHPLSQAVKGWIAEGGDSNRWDWLKMSDLPRVAQAIADAESEGVRRERMREPGGRCQCTTEAGDSCCDVHCLDPEIERDSECRDNAKHKERNRTFKDELRELRAKAVTLDHLMARWQVGQEGESVRSTECRWWLTCARGIIAEELAKK